MFSEDWGPKVPPRLRTRSHLPWVMVFLLMYRAILHGYDVLLTFHAESAWKLHKFRRFLFGFQSIFQLWQWYKPGVWSRYNSNYCGSQLVDFSASSPLPPMPGKQIPIAVLFMDVSLKIGLSMEKGRNALLLIHLFANRRNYFVDCLWPFMVF